jgi:hypothetical protein
MPLEMEYLIHFPESGETLSGKGVLKNLGPNGAYFTCVGQTKLEAGQVSNFTLSLSPAGPSAKTSQVRFRGLVLRLEPVAEEPGQVGVAVRFMSPLETSPG